MNKELTRSQWALNIAFEAAEASEDPYVKVGAVALRHDFSIAGVSYNGAPPNVELDWSNRDERRKRVLHAEQNLFHYIKPKECYLVAVTMAPCLDCIKQLAGYGIKQVVFKYKYDKCDFNELVRIATEFGIHLRQLHPDNQIFATDIGEGKAKDIHAFWYMDKPVSKTESKTGYGCYNDDLGWFSLAGYKLPLDKFIC